MTPTTPSADSPVTVELKHTERALDVAAVRYDRAGDQHYDVASAFIKSIRGSDVDAALHYLARMLEAGEDPRFIARRIVISAAEDVGMADPTALQTAVAAAQAVQLIGMPEGRIVLAEAVVHLATAPKSNAAYMGINKAIADVRAGLGNGIPAHLRDAHYPGSKQLGHGKGYKYAHDAPHSVASQQYPPDDLVGRDYYEPTANGAERDIAVRLERLRKIIRGKLSAAVGMQGILLRWFVVWQGTDANLPNFSIHCLCWGSPVPSSKRQRLADALHRGGQ